MSSKIINGSKKYHLLKCLRKGVGIETDKVLELVEFWLHEILLYGNNLKVIYSFRKQC